MFTSLLTFLILVRFQNVLPTCSPEVCNNAGTCADDTGSPICTCVYGYYEGDKCEKVMDNCEAAFCAGGSKCKNHIGNYFCNCAAGYVGFSCTVRVDDPNNRLLNPRLLFNHLVLKGVASRLLVVMDQEFKWGFQVLVEHDDGVVIDTINTPKKSVFKSTKNIKQTAHDMGIIKYKDLQAEPAVYLEGTLTINNPDITAIRFKMGTVNDEKDQLVDYDLLMVEYLIAVVPSLEMKIIGCSSDKSDPTKIRASDPYTVTLDISFTEKDESYKALTLLYKWFVAYPDSSVHVLPGDKAQLTIPTHAVDNGRAIETWTLIGEMLLPGVEQPPTAMCYFKYQTEDLVVTIASGNSRTSGFAQELILDGSNSHDPLLPQEKNLEGIRISWSCVSSDGVKSPYCNSSISNEIIFMIPAKVLKIGNEYEFTLTLSRTFGDRQVKSEKQKVKIVGETVPDIAIICYKNCLDKYDSNEIGHFRAICENCDENQKVSYLWSGIDEQKTQLGLENERLIISKNAITSKEDIEIKVKATTAEGMENFATRKIIFAASPSATTCTVNPTEGQAAETKFKVVCPVTNDQSDPITGELYQTVEKIETLLSTCQVLEGKATFQSILSYSKEYELFAVFTNKYRMETTVKINPPKLHKPELKCSLSGVKDTFINSSQVLISEGLAQEALPKLISLVDTMEEVAFSKLPGESESFQDNLVKDMLNLADQVDLKDYNSVAQVSQFLNKLSSVNSLKCDAKLKTSKLLDKLMDGLLNDPNIMDKSSKKYERVMSNVLAISTNLMEEDLSKISYEVTSTTMSPQNIDYPFQEDYEDYVAIDADVLDWQGSIEERTSTILKSLSKLKTISGKHFEPGEPPFELTADDMYMRYQIVNTESLEEMTFKEHNTTEDQSSVKFSKGALYLDADGDLEVQMIKIDKNPFWWHPNSFSIDSELILLDISIHEDHPLEKFHTKRSHIGKRINKKILKTTKEKSLLDIFLKLKPQDVTVIQGNVTTSSESDSEIKIHRIKATRKASLHLTFKNVSEAEIQVVVRLDQRPNQADFAFATTYTKETEGVLVTGDGSKATDVSNYYVAVRSVATNISVDSTIAYVIEVQNIICRRWSEQKANWSTDGCVIGLETKQTLAHCRCTPGSLFGAGILVAPNAIDFKKDLKLFLKIGNNLVPVITLLVLFTLWIILMIWGGRKDRQDAEEKTAIFLEDNNPSDDYCYVVIVFTGISSGASTTARVALELIGSEATSKAFILNHKARMIFRRAADDWFILCTPKSLGELKAIRMWHDNTGISPSWYCDRVVVKDLKLNESWLFRVKSWLALDRGKGSLFCTVKAYDKTKESIRDKLELTSLTAQSIRLNHPWAGIFAKHPRSTFTRRQRVTTILSLLLCNMMISLMFYGIPTDNPGDQADYGHFQATFRIVVIAIETTLIVMPINMLAILFFSKSEPREREIDIDWDNLDQKNEQKSNKPEKTSKAAFFKRKYWFPWWGNYVAWSIHGFIIIVTSFFILLYGLKFGKVRSLLWISSLTLGILQDFLLMKPLQIIAIAVAKAIFFDKKPIPPQATLRIPAQDKRRQKENYKIYCENLIRRAEEKAYVPKLKEEIEMARHKNSLRDQLTSILMDLMMFMLYLCTLCWLIIGTKDAMAYDSYRNVIEMTTELKYGGSVEFDNIDSDYMLIQYLNETLLPALFPSEWYEGYQFRGYGWVSDYNCKLLGVPRLRQLRVRNDTCRVPAHMRDYAKVCYGGFWISDMDIAAYNPKWKPFEESRWHEVNKRVSGPWLYQNYWYSTSLPIMGDGVLYPGGGYLAPLGRTLTNSRMILNFLIKSGWLDFRTRAVFIEFAVYNANQNIFNVVSLIAERSGVGTYITSKQVETVKLLIHKEHLTASVVASFILFLSFATLFMLRTVLRVRNLGLGEYFRDYWNIVDIAIILLTIGCMILFFMRGVYVGTLIKTLEDSANNDYVGFFIAANMEQSLNFLSAVLVCTATVRLWKILRFADVFRVMERSIVLAGKHLISLTLVFFLFLITFSFSWHMINGSYAHHFRNRGRSIATLMSLTFGFCKDFDFDSLMNGGEFLGVLMFFAFLCIMSIFLQNMFISVICEYFEDASLHVAHYDSHPYTLWHFIKDETPVYVAKLWDRIRNKFKWKKQEKIVDVNDAEVISEEMIHFDQGDYEDRPIIMTIGNNGSNE